MARDLLNFDDPETKRKAMNRLAPLRGLYWWDLSKARKEVTKSQHGYYRACVVPCFAEYLRQEQGEAVTLAQAHEVLARRFLSHTIVDKQTGEYLGDYVRSTGSLNVAEMGEYIDRCIAFLLDYGIIVPPPGLYLQKEAG